MRDNLAQAWLDLQCQMLPAVNRGVIMLGAPSAEAFAPTSSWPHGAGSTPGLSAAANLVLRDRRSVVRVQPGSGGRNPGCTEIACPLLSEGRLLGVVAVESALTGDQHQRAVVQLLQLGSTWLDLLLRREASAITSRLMTVVGLVATGLERDRFQASAAAAATELAAAMSCERVSIGFVEGRSIRLRAVSNSAAFAERSSLVRSIEAAMDEAVDEDGTVTHPPPDDETPRISAAHSAHARQFGEGAICTVPFGGNGRVAGALMLERSADVPFRPEEIELAEAVGSVLGPILDLKRRDDRWIAVKAWESLRAFTRRLLGAGHVGVKLVAFALAAAAAFLAVATGEHRVVAPASLEGRIQRVVAAPLDGYVASTQVRPGDVVQAGDELGRLDDEDLALERLKWTGQREQLRKEHREALATHDRVQSRILTAQLAQAEAQVKLLDAQLARTRIVAPFDGIVVSGDLSQSLGAPVERGQVLFQLAPLDAYRVVLRVDERDIAALEEGGAGHVALTAFPGDRFDLEVDRVTPVAEAEGGLNTFRVEARLLAASRALRPGMKGVAKIDAGERSLVWIWTHRLADAVRLWLWSHWGAG